MRMITRAAAIAAALFVPLAAATAAIPVKVTRFHLNMPITPGAVSIRPGDDVDPKSIEQQQIADAVAAEFAAIGFTPERRDAAAPLVATISFARTTRDETAANKPVTIGIGGGSYGGGVGGGLGLGFGIGKRAVRTFYATELFVQLRRSDGTAVWEGRAQMEANAKSKEAQPGVMATKLSRALFRGFPGESGRTITVR